MNHPSNCNCGTCSGNSDAVFPTSDPRFSIAEPFEWERFCEQFPGACQGPFPPNSFPNTNPLTSKVMTDQEKKERNKQYGINFLMMLAAAIIAILAVQKFQS